MRPLRDSDGASSPIDAEAIELVRSAARHDVMPGAKQRVRARLLQQPLSRRRTWIHPLVVVSLLLAAAAASAAAGRTWISETLHALVTPVRARPPAPLSARPPHVGIASGRAPLVTRLENPRPLPSRPAAGAPFEVPGDSVAAPVEPGPPPTAGVSPAAVETTRPHPGAIVRAPRNHHPGGSRRSALLRGPGATARELILSPSPSPSPPRDAAAPAPAELRTALPAPGRLGSDTELVFEAMRALRQQGQPFRAERLLGEYLRLHPRGELAEEALALSVEAAVVRDPARARRLIERYLERYPQGHFRVAVENSRAQLPP